MTNRVASKTIRSTAVSFVALAMLSACLSDEEEAAPADADLTETNMAPEISGIAPTTVNAGQVYSFTPNASDSDGDALAFSISGLPLWASFDAETGRVSGTPAQADVGTYNAISMAVTDGQATDSLAAFSITVHAFSLGSATLNWIAPTENEDGSTLTDLAGYKVYWGTSAGSYPYSTTIDNASVTTYVVENLSPGAYEFVTTSFNLSGVESRYSDLATKVIQ